MLRKRNIFIMLFMIVLFANTLSASASDKKVILYQREEIVNTDILLDRAKSGINELEQNTGVKIQRNVPRARTTNDVEYYQTSQLLNRKIENDYILEEYAITTFGIYDSYIDKQETNSGGGCILKSTIYAVWNVSTNEMQMRYSMANVSGIVPKELYMQNNVMEGWLTNKEHINNNTWNNPKDSYFLNAPTDIFVGDYPATLRTIHIIYLSNGSSFRNDISIDVTGYN